MTETILLFCAFIKFVQCDKTWDVHFVVVQTHVSIDSWFVNDEKT